ncbi:hypothetical protein W97_06909 [Coniosporium apollinis CBS 100218]|uniref:Uncharacterized protein n=1 Tax=Coniosporium apollinis (strain CBS 100218) TaxID=1168221 RepID=R7Z0U7_CONA1|nr:uncharacterized protein W97_06909 [Coniosporium apollinis CBS 100218]EON67541.1 hypothetical protein W97_06909 [Coniosporium apollinis CBS 100218]
MTMQGIVAMFVLVELTTEKIDSILREARSRPYEPWCYWLADQYETAPPDTDEGGIDGTKAPIDKDWKSPFIGRTLRECADFLRKAPSSAWLDRNFFAVVEEHTLDKGVITLCRIGNWVGEGDEITSLPARLRESGDLLGGMDPDSWDEWLEDTKRTGKPA